MPIDWEELKLAHGPVVRVELGGVELAFRQMPADEAEAVATRFDLAPQLSLNIAHDACRACCVAGWKPGCDPEKPPTWQELFDEVADLYPLAFSAESGICETLLKMASDAIAAEIKAAIRSWRNADRNLGKMASSLLAFQAYKGGQPSAEELAGALHLAELIDHVKGTYKLHLSFMRAMGKGKR